MTDNQRIKKLRKSLDLNQEEFGKPIGLTQSAIAVIEKGGAKVTEQTKLLIIHIYKTTREWIEDGNGEMIVTSSIAGEPNMEYVNTVKNLQREVENWKNKYIDILEKYNNILNSQLESKDKPDHDDKRNVG